VFSRLPRRLGLVPVTNRPALWVVQLLLLLLVLLLLAPLVACKGSISSPGGDPGAGETGPGGGAGTDGRGLTTPRFAFPLDEVAPETGLRMATRWEFAQAIADFTGVAVDVAGLPRELDVQNLDNDAARSTVRDVGHMQTLLEIATDVAIRADLDALLPCAADACTDDELRAFLASAFVREVGDSMLAPYRAAFDEKLGAEGAAFARRTVVQMALISPYFLYRTEIGAAGELTGFELAAKLSYFLWGTRPDPELLASAEAGALLTSAEYAAQVDRLLESPRAQERVTWLIHLWLGTDDFDHQVKTAAAELPEGLTELFYEEVRLLIEDVLFTEGGSLADLVRADYTYLNDTLAAHYGMGPVGTDEFVRVDLAGTDRRGILTTGLVLSAHSKENGRSPIQRGAFLLQELMCHGFAPDAGIPAMALPDVGPDATFRERFEPLETTAPCSNCHQTLNAGFAFERFDEVGRLQPEDVVMPDEVRGFFDLPPYDRIEFETTAEAVDGFATHPALQRCFVTQTYRYAQGRLPGSQDRAVLEALEGSFTGDVVGLFREIALSGQFRRGVN